MSLYQETINSIVENRDIRNSGKLIALPFYKMPRLSKVLPGIMKGRYSVVTAGSKEGKTQLTDFLYMYQPIEYILDNPDCGLELKIKYFSLELSKEVKMAQAMCYRLFTKHNIVISPDNLMSIFNEYILDDKILSIIKSEEFIEWFNLFEKTVEFIDNIKHPTGIRINVEAYANDNGHYTYKDIDWQDSEGNTIRKSVKDKYVANNPDEIMEVIVDHAALLSERSKTLYQCIKELSSEHFLYMRDKWKYSPILVMQQSADSLTQQFTSKGGNILDKVKPTPEGLANCKDVRQDLNLLIGVFSPYKYKEAEYEGWNLTKLRDNHREISIMMNRNGKANASIQVGFWGSSNVFRELPQEENDSVYRYVYDQREKEMAYYKPIELSN